MQDKKSALVIDNMPQIRTFLREGLESDGFDVRDCRDGAAALEGAVENDYQVVIVDYRMPGMNGVEVTKRLRRRYPAAVIIGISSEDMKKDFSQAGADYFLLKPFNYADLRKFVKAKP